MTIREENRDVHVPAEIGRGHAFVEAHALAWRGLLFEQKTKKSGFISRRDSQKGIGRNFKVIEAKAEKKRKEAKK